MEDNNLMYDSQEGEKQPLLAQEPPTYNGDAGGEPRKIPNNDPSLS